MLLRILILITVLFGTITALTGAWSSSSAPSAQDAETAFSPQTIVLDPGIVGTGIDARALLRKALEKLAPSQQGWMKTKIRQTMMDGKSKFVADGFLQRGPHYCARLELEIKAGATSGRLLVVSDGEVLAQVRDLPGAPPQIGVERLPDDGKDAYLSGSCCGGPVIVLQQVEQHLQNGKLQTGMLGQIHVIRVHGDIPSDATPLGPFPVRGADVYLDATTLWPARLDWHGASRGSVLRLEFLEPELDRECPVAECIQLFSYRLEDDQRAR